MGENKEVNDKNKNHEKDKLSYDNDQKQTVFKIFGIAMMAPIGLKNPRLIYISFIAINFFLLILIRNLITN